MDAAARTVRCASTLAERRHLSPSGPQRPAQPGKLFKPSRQAPVQLLNHFLHATLAGPPIGMLKGVDNVLVLQASDVKAM